MPDRFLAVNAGSSSLKFALLADRGGDLVLAAVDDKVRRLRRGSDSPQHETKEVPS